MIEYKKSFWNEMKSLFLYIVEFSKDRSMLSKAYLNICRVNNLNWKPIFIIIYNKSIFFANNYYQKVWTFNSQKVIQ